MAHDEAPRRQAFTLVEMLVVMAIIVVLLTLIVPAISKSAGDVNKAIYDLQGALEVARTYAVSNHTYTWVGFFEEDVSTSSTTPATSGVGRVVISTVASRDGTPIYDPSAVAAGTATQTIIPPGRLLQIGKLVRLQNIHVCTPASTTDAFGQRPGNHLPTTNNNRDRVGLSGAGAPLLFGFQYPLSGTAQYTFGIRPAPQSNGVAVPSAVIQFSPQGEVTSDAGPLPGVAPCKEIAIEASHGNSPDTGHNAAAVDLAGLTGQATIYRP